MTNQIDRKKLILESALENFIEDGYDRATIQDIANKAGVGKGTIYEYFSSKEELFYEVILTAITHAFSEWKHAVSKPGPIESKIRGMYEQNVELFRSQTDLRAIMLKDIGKIPKQVHQQVEKQQAKMLTHIENILIEAMKNGEVVNIHPGMAAAIVLNGLSVIYSYQLKETETLEEVIEQQLQLLFGGMKPS